MITGHGAVTGSRARVPGPVADAVTRAVGHAPQVPPRPERSEAPRPGLGAGGVEGPGPARVVVVVMVVVVALLFS